MELEPEEKEPFISGEDSGTDMRRPLARHANQKLKRMGDTDSIINLGEHGEIPVGDVRFRDDSKIGHLKAYIREKSPEHPGPIITISVVALGLVAAGIYSGIKYRKK